MCVVIGFTLKGKQLDHLVLAADVGDGLQHVGSVKWGLSNADYRKLGLLFAKTMTDKPIVDCSERAFWVEPKAFVLVR